MGSSRVLLVVCDHVGIFIQDAAKVVTLQDFCILRWVESVKVIDEKALKRGREAAVGAL